jgi:hypothetical protein
MNHIAAIHCLKKTLKLSDDDYRFHLRQATAKDSCKAMNPVELAKARAYFDNWKALSQAHRTMVNLAFADWLAQRSLESVKQLRSTQNSAIQSLKTQGGLL